MDNSKKKLEMFKAFCEIIIVLSSLLLTIFGNFQIAVILYLFSISLKLNSIFSMIFYKRDTNIILCKKGAHYDKWKARRKIS